MYTLSLLLFFFFFNDTATTEIYTLSLHDALPISDHAAVPVRGDAIHRVPDVGVPVAHPHVDGKPRAEPPPHGSGLRLGRSEEHTSELQSRSDLVCRLLLEKKKKNRA